MKKQRTFSDVEYDGRKLVSRREKVLDQMDAVMPWAKLAALIEPFSFLGARGRPPKGIEIMLRMYFLSVWYNLAHEAVEEAVYDSCSRA